MINRMFVLCDLRLSLAKHRLMLVVIAAGAALLLLVSSVVGQGTSVASGQLPQPSGIGTIKLTSASVAGNAVQLTHEALDHVLGVRGVEAVQPWAQEGLMPESQELWADANTPLVFWATPRIRYAQPSLVAPRGPEAALADNEIILPATIGDKSFAACVERTFSFSYTVATGASRGESQLLDLRVAGLYDNSMPGARDQNEVFVSLPVEEKLIMARSGTPSEAGLAESYTFPAAFVDVTDADTAASVQSTLQAAGYGVSGVSSVTAQPGALRLLGSVNAGLAVLLLLFCVGSGLAIGAAWLRRREREIGLLRALGWTRARIFTLLLAEIAGAGLLSALAGAALGVVASAVVSVLLGGASVFGVAFAGGVTLPNPTWLALVVVGLPVALAVGAIRPLRRLARTDPDDALRRP